MRQVQRRRNRLALALGCGAVLAAWILAGSTPSAAATVSIVGTPPTTSAFATPASPPVPPNPPDAPDPDVVVTGGTYFAFTTGTAWGNFIGVLEASSPTGPYRTVTGNGWGSSALPNPPAWEQPGTQTSPGVVFFGGRWIMYYDAAQRGHAGDTGYDCLAMATASTLGPTATTFTDTSTAPLLCMPSDGGAIDPSPFVDPATGKAWLLWKSNDGGSTQPARIWSAQLSADGASFVTQPVQLMFNDTVDYPWETTVENPQMVVANGTYYLLFSGGIWDSSSYAQGYAVCAGPQGPCTQPQATPFLSSYGSVAGPGGGSLFSPDGTSWYLAYAAWTSGCTSYPSGGATSTCSRRLYVAPVDLPYQSPPTAPTGTGPPMVGVGATGDGQGYWMVDADGSVFAFGDASFFGSMGGQSLAAWMVGMAPTADNAGYWLVASDGGIFAFGDAAFFGSMGGHPLAKPVVGMAATPDGRGYWLVASDGGIFAFGDAAFFGSMAGKQI